MIFSHKTIQLIIVFMIMQLLAGIPCYTQVKYPAPIEGDYVIKEFVFVNGEKLASLNLHYATIGSRLVNKEGKTTNAVIIMHGSTGSGPNFLTDMFAGALFGPGQ